jgi:hypothetical protein
MEEQPDGPKRWIGCFFNGKLTRQRSVNNAVMLLNVVSSHA